MLKPSSINQVDLNLFVIFDAIYREENLTRASEQLCLSQPAVSHALARLRERLDDPLFERSGKRMKPTAFSNSIIQDVRAGLASLESALVRDLSFDPGSSDRAFSIALPQIIEATILDRLVSRMMLAGPGLSLKSQKVARPELEPALKRGQIDLAVDIHVPVGEDIGHTKIARDRLVVVARKDHHVAQQADGEWNLAAYLGAQHVFVSARHYGLGAEDYALSKLDKTRKIAITCQHYYAASQIVSGSDLLLTIPQTYAQQLDSSRYAVLPLPYDMDSLDLRLYWLRKNDGDPANQWLRGMLQTTAEKGLG